MEWYVYYNDSNFGLIIPWNVFNHRKFASEVLETLNYYDNKKNFKKELRRVVMYYFACKSEYEVVISEWVGRQANLKVDVFMQLTLNWDAFVDYVWSKKNLHLGLVEE